DPPSIHTPSPLRSPPHRGPDPSGGQPGRNRLGARPGHTGCTAVRTRLRVLHRAGNGL
ncbi:MAG: hypothetical protein AVDCRST_MAG83-984, partial [uncultured Arthrobacter sp.]